jgi:hypothetical protein
METCVGAIKGEGAPIGAAEAAGQTVAAARNGRRVSSSRKHHQQGFRPPPDGTTATFIEVELPLTGRSLTSTHSRRWAYGLRDETRAALYDVAPRVADCGRKRISRTPSVVVTAEGRAHFDGLARCGSVHACVVCALVIKSRRGAEVTQVVEAHAAEHGRETTYLVTATVRHELGHDLRVVRKGVARARKLMRQGRAWQAWKKGAGYIGEVNAVEVTHGRHGWHPHHHAVMMFDRPMVDSDVAWLKERWAECVAAALGEEHRPDFEHGLVVTQCHKADYISKLGLELNEAMGAKRAASGHRSYLQILEDHARFHRREDGDLVREHFVALYRSKQLNWTPGLRALYGLGAEKSDEELADEATNAEPRLVEPIDGWTWDAIRDIPRSKTSMLEAAEVGGAAALRETIASLREDPRARFREMEPHRPEKHALGNAQGRPRATRDARMMPRGQPSRRSFTDARWRRQHQEHLTEVAETLHDLMEGRATLPPIKAIALGRGLESKPARMADGLTRLREGRQAARTACRHGEEL